MFGRDPYMPLNRLLSQAMRYLGTDEGIPDLEALHNLLQMTTAQIEYAATKRNQSFKPMRPHNIKVGDLVLVRNHVTCQKLSRKSTRLAIEWLWLSY